MYFSLRILSLLPRGGFNAFLYLVRVGNDDERHNLMGWWDVKGPDFGTERIGSGRPLVFRWRWFVLSLHQTAGASSPIVE